MTIRWPAGPAQPERSTAPSVKRTLDQRLFNRLRGVIAATVPQMFEHNERRPHDSLRDMTPVEFGVAAVSAMHVSA